MKRFDREDDETLVALANRGDRACMDELFQRYKNFVRVTARRFFLLGAEPDDLVQEGMIGLFKAIRDYEPGKGSFAAFAKVCIFRQFYTAIKSSNRTKHRALNDSVPLTETEEEEGLIDFESPEDALLSREETDRLERLAAQHLTGKERLVLRDYLSGMRYEEIAAARGMNTKAVDNLLQSNKRKCRQAQREEDRS